MPLRLYHGLNSPSLLHVVQEGALTPRVCAEGGPNAVYFSETPYQYRNVVTIVVPDEEIGYGKRFVPYANRQYITKQPVSLLEYDLDFYKLNGIGAKELASNIRSMMDKKGDDVKWQLREIWENEENELLRFDSLIFDYILDPMIEGWDWRENFSQDTVNENSNMKKGKNMIRLNESQFASLIRESVYKVLSEELQSDKLRGLMKAHGGFNTKNPSWTRGGWKNVPLDKVTDDMLDDENLIPPANTEWRFPNADASRHGISLGDGTVVPFKASNTPEGQKVLDLADSEYDRKEKKSAMNNKLDGSRGYVPQTRRARVARQLMDSNNIADNTIRYGKEQQAKEPKSEYWRRYTRDGEDLKKRVKNHMAQYRQDGTFDDKTKLY